MAAQQAETSPPIDPAWLKFDAASRTATFPLTAGLTPINGALNFNGYDDGQLVFTVPTAWTVNVAFFNHDGMLPHSAEIIPDSLPVPVSSVSPAVSRAYTDQLDQGVPPQGKSSMNFTAGPTGQYFIFCGVPGHGRAGMWIRFVVSATAEVPSIALYKR